MRVTAVLVVALALVIGIVPQFTHCKAMSPSSGSTMSMGGSTAASGGTTATGSGAMAAGTGTMTAGTNAAAKPTPMRCYWTARAELGLALPLAAAGALLFFSRRKETRRALAVLVAVLGVVAMLLPTVLIGVCAQSSAICNTAMRPTLLAAGGLTVALGLFTLVRNELSSGPRKDGQPLAVQADAAQADTAQAAG